MKNLSDLDYEVARRYPLQYTSFFTSLDASFFQDQTTNASNKVLIGIKLSLLSASGLLNVIIT